MSKESIRERFLRSLSAGDFFLEDLMDMFPDIALSVKDRDGRYVSANRSLLDRLGLKKKTDIVGKRPEDLFPESMAARYVEQDERVLATRAPVCNNLDVTIYPDGSHGWCLTSKFPLRDRGGHVAGIACISSGRPIIRGNTISGNRIHGNPQASGGRGAGIYCGDDTSPLILNNVIKENINKLYGEFAEKAYGGGLFLTGYGNIKLIGNMI